MKRALVIEDGTEYEDFARALLADYFVIERAGDGADALRKAAGADCFFVDLRFDRLDASALVGDLDRIARELFGGDRSRAARHAHDQQGLYILRGLRAQGHTQRAVFVQDFSPRRLRNLKSLYGDVEVVPAFDAQRLQQLLGGA